MVNTFSCRDVQNNDTPGLSDCDAVSPPLRLLPKREAPSAVRVRRSRLLQINVSSALDIDASQETPHGEKGGGGRVQQPLEITEEEE